MKWGILATGTIARKFAQTINQMDGETLLAVGSRNPDSAHTFAKEYRIPRSYDSYEALTADPEVEAIYVATPNTLHYQNCLMCLNHGKHVLCEKPFTINPEQAEELYRIAQEKHLFIMEALWTRFLPLYAQLKDLIASGTIGDLRSITCQYGFIAQGARKERKFNSSLGGGALLDIGIYNLGFLQHVAGDPTTTITEKVSINEYGTDEYSQLRLDYPGGIEATCIQTIGQNLNRNARIIGTKGEIVIPDFQMAEQMIVGTKSYDFPFIINGFEYEVRETSRCINAGLSYSTIYTPTESISLMRQLYNIRRGWNMRFEGEE